MDLTGAKILAMVVIFLSAIIGAYVAFVLEGSATARATAPAWVMRPIKACCTGMRHQLLSSVLHLACGGVLLAGALVHLLSDAQEALSEVTDFPWAATFCGLGFLLTLGVEACAREATSSHAPTSSSPSSSAAAASASVAIAGTSSASGASSRRTPLSDTASLLAKESPDRRAASPYGTLAAHPPPAVDAELALSPGPLSPVSPLASTNTASDEDAATGHGHDHGHGHGHDHMALSEEVPWSVALALFGSLGFHSFLEGVATGVSPKPSVLTGLVVAIIAHKGLATMALSTSMLRSGVAFRTFALLMTSFSAITPVGILVGLLASSLQGLEDSPAMACILATAAGTFLYVGAVEMVLTEMMRQPSPVHVVGRWCIVFAGFALMSLLAIWT